MNNYLEDPQVLRELIMDHYQYPRHHELTQDEAYSSVHMASDSCIDDITVQSLIRDGVIEDVRFDGVACTIATASTSMMSELVVGKSVEEAKHIIEEYFHMVNEEPYDAELLEEAIAMKNVYKQANRIKCATIGWKAITQLIEESEKQNG